MLHLAYWIMLTFCVEFIDAESYKCFAKEKMVDAKTGKETGTWVWNEVESTPIINYVGEYVKILHLVCFFFGLVATWWVPKKLTSNTYGLRVVLNFVTVPLYIFTIFWLESGLEDLRYKFKKESTHTDLRVNGTVCVAKEMGNIEQWAQLEIVTFYCNIITMIFYLLYTRVFYRSASTEIKSEKKEDEEEK